MKSQIKELLSFSKISTEFPLWQIAEKIFNNKRITVDEGLLLYKKGELGFLGALANFVCEQKNKNFAYYISNFHIEYTNICINKCKFCPYSKSIEQGYELTIEQILAKVKEYKNTDVSEIHIIGGIHPDRDAHYYSNLIREIRNILPSVHIKAFTAVEIDYMSQLAGINITDCLKELKSVGVGSLPGGGAEIFDEEIRKTICHHKTSSEQWLNIHKTAHQLGMPTNATMLYGHIENYHHRIKHLEKLRNLQDESGSFRAFVPLKFRNKNNQMSYLHEVSVIEDLKNYAVSRIFLDNFQHIKAYWPMIGKETTQLSLSFGVDDIDGTIDDTTKIYTNAGAEEQKPAMTSEEMIKLIKDGGKIPIERDGWYNIISIKSRPTFS